MLLELLTESLRHASMLVCLSSNRARFYSVNIGNSAVFWYSNLSLPGCLAAVFLLLMTSLLLLVVAGFFLSSAVLPFYSVNVRATNFLKYHSVSI